jgi:hypothetical protein
MTYKMIIKFPEKSLRVGQMYKWNNHSIFVNINTIIKLVSSIFIQFGTQFHVYPCQWIVIL